MPQYPARGAAPAYDIPTMPLGFAPVSQTAEYAGLPGTSGHGAVGTYNSGNLAGSSCVPLYYRPPGHSGVMTDLNLIIGSTGMCLDGALAISYDDRATYRFFADLGTLFCAHFQSTDTTGVVRYGRTPYWATQTSQTQQDRFDWKMPVPYLNGVAVDLYNNISGAQAGANFWATANGVEMPAGLVPAKQLRSSSITYGATAVGGGNITVGANAITLNSPDLAWQGPTGGGPMSATAGQVIQLLNATGAGWIAGHAMTINMGAGFSPLERDFGWYPNGLTVPNPAGTVTTPANGGAPPNTPNGTKVGSPLFQASGTEDYWGSAFYAWEANTVPPINFPASPYGAIISDGNHRSGTFQAWRDILAEPGGEFGGGWPFVNGAQLWWLTEAKVTAAANFSSVVVYYQRIGG
jgi:hypothetical protein